MRFVQGSLRLGMSAAIVIALVASIIDVGRSELTFAPVNFFGYFTVQSNLLTAFVFASTGVQVIARRSPSRLMQWIRPLVVTDMVIVGAVYAALLAPWGQPGGPFTPWANMVLHLMAPLVVFVDWLVAPDRPRVPLSQLWAVLLHPILYCIGTLVRGGVDGWAPYPFLDPALGYPVVFAYIGGLSLTFVLVGLGVSGIGRLPSPVPKRPAPIRTSGAGSGVAASVPLLSTG